MKNFRNKKTNIHTFTPISKGNQGAKRNKHVGKKKPKKHEGNPIMRVAELQNMLGIGKNTIYDLCTQNIIPHKRVGRIILFSRIKITEWIENGENVGGAS